MGKKKRPAEPKPRKPKSNNAELLARVEEVLVVRLDGAQFHDVRTYASEKGWGLTDRQIREYMHRADELLVERQDRSRKKTLARHHARRETLFARAVNAADYRTALAILDSDAKLRGLYPEKDVKELVKLAAAQGARIEELEKRLREAKPTDAHPTGTSPPAAGGAGGAAEPPGGGTAGAGGDG